MRVAVPATGSRHGVHLGHRAIDPRVDDGSHGVGSLLDRHVEQSRLGAPRASQDVVRARLATWRFADPDAHPYVPWIVEMGVDRAQTTVTRSAAAYLDLHATRWKVQLVVDDHEAADGVDTATANQRHHRHTGVVHIGDRHRQRDRPSGKRAASHLRSQALFEPQLLTVATGEEPYRVGADVVPGPLELASWVAEPDDEPVDRAPTTLGATSEQGGQDLALGLVARDGLA